MYSLLIMLDWDIQRRGEYNHPEPNPQQNIPLYLSSTQVSFWHTGCLMFGGSHSHVSSLQLMLLVRCAGWTCSCSSLPGTMSCWCLTPWSCWLTLSWPSTSYRHGVWTTMTKVLIQGVHHALCSNDFLDAPSRGLKMEIVFKRRLTNELLTTYLPSLLLLLMSYATTYFKPFYFEAAVTVNLSILLVTTTLFIRWLQYYIGHYQHPS